MKTKKITTKEKIIEQTISLLNEKGLSDVKMRDVSQILGISIGNLTYHYPKWENLIDAVFSLFQRDINLLYDSFPADISEIVNYTGKIYDIQNHYAFLFSNYYIFFEQFPKYNAVKESFFFERMKIMRNALQRLIDKNLLHPQSKEHNYDLLVKNTWLILSGWYGFSQMFKGTDYEMTKDEFFRSIWNLYVHHLTDEGKKLVIQSYKTLK